MAEMPGLFQAMRHLLEVTTEKQAAPERSPKGWLRPRREEGALYPCCDGAIRRIKAAGRSACLCPERQEKPS